MAQWLGQFSGHTHATKVEGAEDLLRHAIEVFRAADSSETGEKKWKAVTRLAEDLLAARLKLLKARISAASDVQSGVALAERAEEIESLKRRESRVRAGGIDAILKEFGASSAPRA